MVAVTRVPSDPSRLTRTQLTEARAEIDRLADSLFAAAAPLWGDDGAAVLAAVARARRRQGLLTPTERERTERPMRPGGSCPVCGGSAERAHLRSTTTTYAFRRDGWVKIGRAQDVDARIHALTVHPFSVKFPPGMRSDGDARLLATWPGDLEHELHWTFRDHHVTGEWFLADPVVRALQDDGAAR